MTIECCSVCSAPMEPEAIPAWQKGPVHRTGFDCLHIFRLRAQSSQRALVEALNENAKQAQKISMLYAEIASMRGVSE